MSRFTQVIAAMAAQIAASNGELTQADADEALAQIQKDPFGYLHADGASPNGELINELQERIGKLNEQRFHARMRGQFNDDRSAVFEDIDLLEQMITLEKQAAEIKLGELATMREAARAHIAELPAPDPAKVNAPTPSTPFEATLAQLIGGLPSDDDLAGLGVEENREEPVTL